MQRGALSMTQYRIYFLGLDRHYFGVENIECASDRAAIEKAQQFLDRHDVELWDCARFIGRYHRADPKFVS
jgi:hypothetical protein